MEDKLICLILELIWYPIALISFMLTVFLTYRRMKEGDAGRWIKYPVLLLFLSLTAIPVSNYLLEEELLPLQCKPITPPPPNCYIINEFSDGSTTREIRFPEGGGMNTTALSIPKGVKVSETRIGVKHPSKPVSWTDEFSNWSRIGSYSGITLNDDENYALMNISRLMVDSKIVLNGLHIFDEVYIKEGGEITTSIGEKLTLKVKNTLIIEEHSGINVDGKGNSIRGRGGDGTSTGIAYFGTFGSGGGGGGCGGRGGKGGDDANQIGGAGGRPYGSETEPVNLGSPGGRGGGSGKTGDGDDGARGLGGGAVKIEAREVIVNGYISADGVDGEDSAENDGTGGGGGGSGGGIYIITDNFLFNGEITANGGDGGDDRQDSKHAVDGCGGGGSGGRISAEYETKTGDGTISVRGGGGGINRESEGNEGEKGAINWVKKPAAFSQLTHANLTSVVIKPDNLKGWGLFYAKATVPGGTEVVYGILDTFNNSILCEITQEDALSGYNLSACASGVDAIKLHTSMLTVSTSITPLLHYWRVSYDTEIKNLGMNAGMDSTKEYANPSLSGETVISDNNTNPKISEEITRLVKDCDCKGCTPSKDECTISISFSVGSTGSLILENLRLEYCIPQ